MSRIGAAIVGTGFMGWVHAEALRRTGVEVVGILGSTAAKSEAASKSLSISRAYSRLDEALSDPDIQSVHVVTSNRHHFEMAKCVLEAGKHIMCEKPLAMNSKETLELLRLAAARPKQAAGVNYNIRFYPLCIEARERVHSGSIGEIFHVTGSYVQDWLLKPTDYNWRVLDKEGGALRAVADIGTHWLDLVQSISGLKVEAVCADLETVHQKRFRPKGEVQTFSGDVFQDSEPIEILTEDFGSIMLRFSGSNTRNRTTRGSMHVSQVASGHKNCLRFEIAGSKQSLAWNSELPNELWIGNRDRSNECLMRDPALMTDAAKSATQYPGGHNEGYADSFKQCFRAFYQYIEAGDFDRSSGQKAPFPTFEDGHREVVLGEAVLKSHQEQRWVKIEEIS